MSEKAPIKIDVAVLTVNQGEDDGVNRILKLKRKADEGFPYYWGYLKNKFGEKLTIAHVSCDDKSGIAMACHTTSQICDILCPSYLFILGIAGGRQKNDPTQVEKADAEVTVEPENGTVKATERVELGDIFVSKIIRHGPIGKDAIRENPVMQPDTTLFKYVRNLKNPTSWQDPTVKPPPQWEIEQTVHTEDLVSTDELIENLLKNPKLEEILKKLPRAKAVDMEAGGVAQTLLQRYSDGKWTPSLFVIKGISDIIDPIDDESAKKQQEVRHLWTKFAAESSALFARSLIKNIGRKNTTHPTRFMPNQLSKQKVFSNSYVYSSIKIDEYSDVAAHLLNRVAKSNEYEDMIFFTFCAYNPDRLFDAVKSKYNHSNTDKKVFMQWAKKKFRHFEVFSNTALNNKEKCVRILLLDGSTLYDIENKPWYKNVSEHSWNFFLDVNGDVPCWGIGIGDLKSIFPNSDILRDYVIIGDKILLNYYDETQTLMFNDVYKGIKSEHTKLIELFNEFNGNDQASPFKSLDTLEKEAVDYFKNISQNGA